MKTSHATVAKHYDDFTEDKTMASNVNLWVNKIFLFVDEVFSPFSEQRSGVHQVGNLVTHTSRIDGCSFAKKMRFS